MLRESNDLALYRSGQTSLGYIDPASPDSNALDDLISLFHRLSGAETSTKTAESTAPSPPLQIGRPTMIADTWMLNDTTLRSRWQVEENSAPTVIRGYQIYFNPTIEMRLCGEGIVYNSLDCIDLALYNSFLPLLIVHADPDGRLRGATLLPFPSLCRGGIHYGELLALHATNSKSDSTSPDLLELSYPLVLAIDAVSRGRARPLVGRIRVDLRGADGTEAIFRPDLQQWLWQSFGIDLTRGNVDVNRDENALRYLEEALSAPKTGKRRVRRGTGLWLDLPALCVPTFQILAVHAPQSGIGNGLPNRSVAMSHICADIEPTTVKHVIELSSADAEIVDLATDAIAPSFPRLTAARSGKASIIPVLAEALIAAIRFPDPKPRHQADLMMPVARNISSLMSRSAPPVATHIVTSPATWSADRLLNAIATLHVQQTGAPLSLILLTPGSTELPKSLTDACDHFFSGRWQAVQTMTAPEWRALADSNVMILGPDILVHDSRTIASLSALVADDRVATSECVLVHAAEAMKGWSASVRSAGAVIWANGNGDEIVRPLTDIDLLPRTTYPIAATCPSLWMARAAWLAETNFVACHSDGALIAPASNPARLRVCTSLISATSVDKTISPPQAPSRSTDALPLSLRVKVLQG